MGFFFTLVAQLVFFAFVIIIVIVLANLLIGLAVSDIQGLQESAKLNSLVRYVHASAQMERFIFLFGSNKYVTKIQNLFLVLDPSINNSNFQPFTLKPNDRRCKRFPRKIKESLLEFYIQNISSPIQSDSVQPE